ncbi:MAG TPA: chloride channel protein, partial [Victivallales bacterium]|nr:chloride channel protein [Victivallales bacterium]
IGSAIGSAISQFIGANERRTITLLAAGAAAGISATFNAPIAGVIFATEVIMKRAGLKEFGAIVVASVASSVVSHSFLGDNPAFSISKYGYESAELPFYIILGFFCAIIAVVFTKFLHRSETFFEKMKLDWTFKPALGGLLCGAILYFAPEIYGSGFPTITKTLDGSFSVKFLLLLLVAKIVATSFTLGSGGSGGVFAPLLFLGAVFGSIFEKVSSSFFPSIVSGHGAYATVGMAAIFAAAYRSPVTAILLIFEMTRDYNMVLPLMFATVIAVAVAEKISKENICTSKLAAMGVDFDMLESKNLLETISVEDAMIPETHIVKIPAYMPIRDLESYFHMKEVKRCIVIDSVGKLFGVINIKDLYKRPDIIDSGIVADICSRKVVTMREDDSLEDAAMTFGSEPYHTIPVVDSFDRKKIKGLLRREDIISAYSNALKNKNVVERFMKSRKIEKAVSAELLEIRAGNNYSCVGKKLSEIKLPDKCNIVTIFRNKEQIIPDGKTEILLGDNLVILCSDSDKVIKILREG